jgi:hypothetical protein
MDLAGTGLGGPHHSRGGAGHWRGLVAAIAGIVLIATVFAAVDHAEI